MIHLIALLTVLWPSVVLATVDVTLKLSATNCLFGCFDALDLVSYSDIPATAGYYDGYCNSVLFRTSLLACTETYCSSRQETAGWKLITEYCTLYGEVDLPSLQDVKAEYDPNNVTTVDIFASTGEMMNSTIIPDETTFSAGYRTENVWNREMNFHHAFGWSMYILFGATVVFGIINRLIGYMARKSPLGAEESGGYPASKDSFLTRLNDMYARHLSTPALLGYRHCEPWGWLTIPTRLQGVLIFIYVLINIVFCCAAYDIFSENLYWPQDNADQIARYLADRTAILSFYNLPLLWVLAGRNDIILWVTGWSYTSANLFHRWVARMTVVEAIIHSAAWTWIEREYLAEEFAEQYWATGVFATVCMCLLLPFSILPLRQRWYEIFLLIHIVLGIAVLVLLWYHVKIMDGDYNAWIWACVAIWGFDRVLRLIRVVVLSFHVTKGANAIVTLGQHGLMRISVTTGIQLRPKPGQYYFLYSPRTLTPWENHPFTLASWTNETNTNTSKSKTQSRLEFLIAPRFGATSKLYRQVARSGGILESTILLDGPYGSQHDNLETFDSILFVAGGSGISAILPYLSHIIASDSFSKKSITVIWAIRQVEYASDILENELKEFIKTCDSNQRSLVLFITDPIGIHHLPPTTSETTTTTTIAPTSGPITTTLTTSLPLQDFESPVLESQEERDIEIFTKDIQSSSETGSRSGSNDKSTKTSIGIRQITGQRPVMRQVIQQSISHLVGEERLAVFGCGPGTMMDDLRKAVCDSYGNQQGQLSAHRLEYFEDQFGW
ncbi:ferric reductase like transmembrane component-domain-containing protein [Naematelia encephala]|uniref:Ferric reductase like transmembrane component-domain-containing protein n=1 Tax=Naematelia encephala TaxID=71784 RepID=A0A1Y2B084_9TREE|nr:ferric reductase like transmembrane component-domain-containing protein [Naematelia encephala]